MRILLLLVFAAVLQAAGPEADIKAVLDTQVKAWNRGDIPTFVTTYADDCIFVGKKITQGRAQLLQRYQHDYPTPAAMGQLKFSALSIHLIDDQVAIVTAEWHLERSASSGGPVGGIFSLVLRNQGGAWKIALDHTS